eukprot:scaffold137401_cov31-Tisochrysis_lutea.AAC.5
MASMCTYGQARCECDQQRVAKSWCAASNGLLQSLAQGKKEREPPHRASVEDILVTNARCGGTSLHSLVEELGERLGCCAWRFVEAHGLRGLEILDASRLHVGVAKE